MTANSEKIPWFTCTFELIFRKCLNDSFRCWVAYCSMRFRDLGINSNVTMVAYGKLNSSVVPKQRPLIPIFRVSRIYFPNFGVFSLVSLKIAIRSIRKSTGSQASYFL